MLTPVDIQQKKFKTGFGYSKDDVTKFFEEVSRSYEELYRSNAELKEKVITLNDGLQHYKTTEEQLQKNLMLAEKNSQQSVTNAAKEAKNIELEAKNRANEIVNQAYKDLERMENKLRALETRYAEYKSEFATLVKKMFEVIDLHDIDPDAKIDPNFASSNRNDKKNMQGTNFGRALGVGFETLDDLDIKEDFDDFEKVFGNNSLPERRSNSKLGRTNLELKGSKNNTDSANDIYGSMLGGTGIDPFKSGDNNSPHLSSRTTTDSAANSKDEKVLNFANKQNSKEEKPKPTFTIKEDKEEDYKPKHDAFSSASKTLSFRPASEYNDIESMMSERVSSSDNLRHHVEDEDASGSLGSGLEQNLKVSGNDDIFPVADEDGFTFL